MIRVVQKLGKDFQAFDTERMQNVPVQTIRAGGPITDEGMDLIN